MPKSIKLFKDKKKARAYRNKQRTINYKRGAQYAFFGHQRWSESDEELIMNSQESDRILAKKLKRTMRAIQGKRQNICRRFKSGLSLQIKRKIYE